MSNNPKVPARNFLESFSSDDGKQILESLTMLCEILENKVDPDPVEIRLVQSLYEVIEHLRLIEYNLRTYVNEGNPDLKASSKLSDLFESTRGYGTSVLFD